MAGPFIGYAPPGVYDKTLINQSVAEILAEVRIPAIIGTAQEYKRVVNYDMVRGSSSSRDNRKLGEDLSYQANGVQRTFQVAMYPIVTGSGSGIISTNPNQIEVYINDVRAVVNQLIGSMGQFVLQIAPKSTDTIIVNYYYKLTDTKIIDENVSVQANGTNKTFYTAHNPLVDGTNSGTPTTTITDVIVKVQGSVVAINEVSGLGGYVVLETAPLITDTVTITYYYNKYSNTSDDLPFLNPLSFETVGMSPNSNDFTEGVDYVIADNKIYWGTVFTVNSKINSTGSELFDSTQIQATLIDERIYLEDVSTQFTGLENFFTVAFAPIVDGSGKDITSSNPADVKVYINGIEVSVARINGEIGKIYLSQTPILGDTVEVSYYRNTLVDQIYTFIAVVSGAAGIGTYSILKENGLPVYNAEVDTVLTTGTPDWTMLPATSLINSVDEVVTLTFTSPTEFTVTSSNPNGSTGSGILGRTYVDSVTGLTLTLATTSVFIATDIVVINVNESSSIGVPIITSNTDFKYCIPGLKLLVKNTTNVAIGDEAELVTYNKSGNEPSVGDIYYVTYTYEKVAADYLPKVYTRFRDVVNDYGELSTLNPLTLGSWLAFTNGSTALILKQVLKQSGLETAADSNYIAALTTLERPVQGYNAAIILPLTTSLVVHQAVKNHVNIFSSERYRSERVHIFGFATGTEFPDAMAAAESFRNERSWCVYPDGAIISLTDEFNVEREYIIDGSFITCALAGLNVSPVMDEATSMISKTLVGIKRLVRELTEVEKDQVAASGVIIVEQIPGAIRIRDSLTTDLSNPFTKRPEIVTTRDAVQRIIRTSTSQFIGKKILSNTRAQIENTVASTLKGLVDRNLIAAYDSNILVEQDESDPSFFRVTCFYQPIFGLAYIEVTFNIRTKI